LFNAKLAVSSHIITRTKYSRYRNDVRYVLDHHS